MRRVAVGRWRRAATLLLCLPLVAVPTAQVVAQDALPEACADADPAPFADRDRVSPVHRPAVDCLHHLGVVQGETDRSGALRFRPHTEVERDQFAGMLHATLDAVDRAAGLTETRRPRFVDVPAGHPFDDHVHELAHERIVEGVDEDRFLPDGPVRRDQAAALLVRATEWTTGRQLTADAGPYYADTTGSAFREDVAAAFEYRLVDGVERPCADRLGRFRPNGHVQRQQAASLLVNALAVFEDIETGGGGDRRPDPECPSPTWVPDIREAAAFADGRDNSTSFAVIGTVGELVGHRAATRVPMASVLKVMFMAAWLRQPDVRDRALTDDDRALLEPMIRRSANEPATRIADALGPGPLYALADEAGMRDFSYTRPWGLSRSSARDQVAFMLEVDSYIPERHRAYALRLLTEIVPEQRWGIGETGTDGWTKHFKGGWGSGTGKTDHQVVLLIHGDGTRVALAVMTTDSPSHDYGKNTLRGVFHRLLNDLPE